MNELGVDRVHLIGYSYGAWHAVLVALPSPERLASVTLIERDGVFDKPSWRVLLKMVRSGMRRTDENIRKLNDWLSPGYVLGDLEFAPAKKALNYRPGWARMLKDAEVQSIPVPMLVISGTETVVSIPEQVATGLADLLPETGVEIYAGSGSV